jgi:hypothetical protein
MLRSVEMRDSILLHYGFKVNYMESKENMRKLPTA